MRTNPLVLNLYKILLAGLLVLSFPVLSSLAVAAPAAHEADASDRLVHSAWQGRLSSGGQRIELALNVETHMGELVTGRIFVDGFAATYSGAVRRNGTIELTWQSRRMVGDLRGVVKADGKTITGTLHNRSSDAGVNGSFAMNRCI